MSKKIELKEVFTSIYENNLWGSGESRSGSGSELSRTKSLREELPIIFKKYNIKSVLDIPCGDFNWMNQVDYCNIEYIGADIVEKLILKNKSSYPNTKFEILDITKDKLPKVDLIIARDIFGHFQYKNIIDALENIIKSESKYLLTTSFTKWSHNMDIEDGGWRPINLMIQPFHLKPIYLVNENCTEGENKYNDKCMILFDIQDLFCGY
jgi:hypothetical protein